MNSEPLDWYLDQQDRDHELFQEGEVMLPEEIHLSRYEYQQMINEAQDLSAMAERLIIERKRLESLNAELVQALEELYEACEGLELMAAVHRDIQEKAESVLRKARGE